MPGESEDTTLLLGAEIEVGGNNNISSDNDKNSTVKRCIQIMNGSDSDEEILFTVHMIALYRLNLTLCHAVWNFIRTK